jgi:hypothetical protein
MRRNKITKTAKIASAAMAVPGHGSSATAKILAVP